MCLNSSLPAFLLYVLLQFCRSIVYIINFSSIFGPSRGHDVFIRGSQCIFRVATDMQCSQPRRSDLDFLKRRCSAWARIIGLMSMENLTSKWNKYFLQFVSSFGSALHASLSVPRSVCSVCCRDRYVLGRDGHSSCLVFCCYDGVFRRGCLYG